MSLIGTLKKYLQEKDRLGLAFQAFFVVAIIYGAVARLFTSAAIPLDSDNVYSGIFSMEIVKTGSLLFNGYYLNSANNYLFTELLPFNFIPQVISGYDPMVLRLTSYLTFIAIILVFSYIIYRITDDITNVLLFSALMLTMDMLPFSWLVYPAGHNGTMFFTGILIVLFLFMKNSGKYQALKIAFLGLMVLSDSIIIAWFLLPYTAVFLLQNRGKYTASKMMFLAWMYAVSAAAYIYNNYVNGSYFNMPIGPRNIQSLISFSIPLYIDHVVNLLNNFYHDIATGGAGIDPFAVIGALALFLSITMIVFNYYQNEDRKIKLSYIYAVVSASVISIIYILTTLSQNVRTIRYFTFSFVSFLALISLYPERRMNRRLKVMFLVTVSIVILLNSVNVFEEVKALDFHQDRDTYALIDFLEANGCVSGYGDYWDSHVITYLSKDKVQVRPVQITHDSIVPFRRLSAEKWYIESPPEFFILAKRTNAEQINCLDSIYAVSGADRIMEFGEYRIYVFNQTTGENIKNF